MKSEEFRDLVAGILQKVKMREELTEKEMVTLLLQQLLYEENVRTQKL